MATTYTPAMLEMLMGAQAELATAGHGGKSATAARLAARMGCSVATLYRRIESLSAATAAGARRRRSDAGTAAASVEDLRQISATLMSSQRDTGKRLWSAERAVDELRANGMITTELSSGRLLALLRDNGLHPEQLNQPSATTVLSTPHPNYLWQIDSSTSVLYKDKTGRMRAMASDEFYKNKPQNFARIVNDLITRYLAVDHCSGAFKGRYYLGGESAENLVDFFIYATVKNGTSPMHGVPRFVYTDQGSGNKSGLWLRFCQALDVQTLRHEVGRANATGSVEKHGDIWEREFEGGFPFLDPEQITLDWLNDAGARWAAVHCATKVHRRHRMTRDAAWLRIREDQLRVPASAELLRELAHLEPETRRVSNTQTISVSVKGHGAQTYDLGGIPGIAVGGKVTVRVNAYRAPSVDVAVVDRDTGETVWHTVAPLDTDQFGFPTDAPVIGQSFSPAAKTDAERTRDGLLRETYRDAAGGLPTLEQSERLRKQRAQAFGGRLDPMASVEQTELPDYMPRRGTPLGGAAAPRVHVPQSLTHVEAAKRLRAALGDGYGPHVYAWLTQRHPDGVPDDQIDALVAQFNAPAETSAGADPTTAGNGTTGLRIVR